MRLTRVEKLAMLVHRATFLRECIASGKDAMSTNLWREHPTKHKKIYAEYEPRIKKDAYELAEVEAKIEKLRPAKLAPNKELFKEIE